MPLLAGAFVGPYHITAHIGSGGMGDVYRARDPKLQRDVAIKVLPEAFAADPDRLARFEREALAVAALSHPGILSIHDFGKADGHTYAVMELLEGETLRQRLESSPLPARRAIDIAAQIARALAAAHGKGIVHRDIKPGNVMVTEDGHVKVLDFGLARQFRLPGSNQMGIEGSTVPGRPLGTANYMAPERILQLPLDPRSDLFSLGVILYEMATGRLPFAGASPSDTVTNVLDREPEPLTTLAPDRPITLEHVVTRLLAKRAADRYQSAEHLAEALARIDVPPSTLATRLLRRLRQAR